MGKLCFFIGHQDSPDSLYPALLAEIERHITELGVTEFLAGGYGHFDRMAASAVAELKKRYPVTLTRLLAYHPGEHPVSLSAAFDGSWYPDLTGVPHKAAIPRANRAAIDRADFVIAHAVFPGNARDLTEYAEKHIPATSI